MDNLIITNFVSTLIINDKKGSRTEYKSRYAAALIVANKGKIRFSYGGRELYLTPMNSVFLPKGLNYVNECLEDTESVLVNVDTLRFYREPMLLDAVPYEFALECHDKLKALVPTQTLSGQCETFEIIYSLAKMMLRDFRNDQTEVNPFIAQAIRYMNENYEKADLTISRIANNCHISEIYLRKLFNKEMGISPYQKLLEIRMAEARLLAMEKRPVGEIASCTGYSDVFQFSRAYKRYFGYPPSKT